MSETYTPEPFEDLIEDLYPLSPMQQGMLFHSLSDPQAGAYFQQLICTVQGDLDHAAFAAAWQQVTQRHPVLRTVFLWEELETPVQAVFSDVSLPLVEDDWRDRRPSEQTQALNAYLEDDRQRGFDLAEAPLLRLALFRLDDETTQFVWSYHHALLDGWSVMHILREVTAAYTAAAGGRTQSQLAPPPYREYIAWLQQQDLASAESFWRDTLSAIDAPTTTGVERLIEATAGAERYAEHTLQLDEQTTQTLSNLARRHRLTLNTLVQGAWALLLSRYSGTEAVLFGAVTAGRPASLPEAEQMVGLFTNVLPIAVRIAPGEQIERWLTQIQRQQVAAQEYAYPSLRQIQQWSAIPGGTPLFESIVVFENYPSDGQLSAPNSALTIREIRAVERTHYPLNLVVIPGTRLIFQMTYAEQRFDGPTIERMLSHLQQILLGIAADPEQRLADVSLMTPDERDLLVRWNATAAPLPLERSLAQMFADQTARTPDATAVIWRETRLSYRKVNEQANRLAHLLRQRGVGESNPETPVVVLLPRSTDTLIALLAIFKAGGVYVPLDPAAPVAYQAAIVEETGNPLLITTGDLGDRLPGSTLINLSREQALIDRQPNNDLITPTLPEQAASVMYTSGSTGRPKGIVLTHAQIVKRLAWMWSAYPFGADEIGCHRSTISFSVALWELLGAPLAGRPLLVVPEEAANDPERLIDTLARNQVSRILVVPSLLALILKSKQDLARRLERLKLWSVVGEALPIDLVQLFTQRLPHATLLNQFGSSETLDATCFDTCNQPDDLLSTLIGSPIANTEIYLLDDQMRQVPIGLPGEIYIGSVALARGYLYQPDLTAEKFVPHPFSQQAGARLYRMGDLARYRSDGMLEYIGRKDHQIKVRGVRLELRGIEAILRQHPAIDQAAVAYREVAGEQRLVAYVTSRDDQAPTASALRRFMQEQVPDAMVPSSFVALDRFPMTQNGKIDWLRLPTPEPIRPALETSYRAPESGWEQTIAEIWKELLSVDRVGIDDNFFDLGGHSLLAIQAHSKLQAAIDRDLTITDLFRFPTIRALATYLSDEPTQRPQIEVAGEDDRFSGDSVQSSGDIAIIGLAGRFPGAATLEDFWQNLASGTESISFFSDDALIAAGVEPALLNNPHYVKASGALDDIELFDAAFFGYTPREAAIMDPQQRLLLEVAWEALERAGYDTERFPGRIGLFAGVGSNTYLMFNLASQPDLLSSIGAMPTLIANEKDFATTRVAYKLSLSGPSVTVQTACSTSLVATHLACRSLLSGEAEIVLAGGASVNPLHRAGYLYTPGSIVSNDGHCRAFDADAQGSIFGSGLGLVVLKRLDAALRDGDTIYATIKGSAINNDGSAKIGYTAPSVERQAEVIMLAHRQAGIDPATISYVEAHGSGTPIGDPIEVAALTEAFRKQTKETGFCALGSVKTNIGHLDAAAGIAGLIKTTLALQHQQIPASLNFEHPNPAIDFTSSPFYVNTSSTPWTTSGPRRAGVSSFGIGGTNVHIVLEEAPPQAPSDPAQPWQLLVLSAKTSTALDVATANLANFLRKHPEANLADVAYTLQLGRRSFAYRRALVCQNTEDALQILEAGNPARLLSALEERRNRPVVFMFLGLGDQYVNMASELYRSESVFREYVDRCCEFLLPKLGVDLREVLYPQSATGAEPDRQAGESGIDLRRMLGRDSRGSDPQAEQLNQITLTQPAVFVIEYALAQLWISWGVTPSSLIGYSMGEYVAACLAGVFSLEDALTLLARRAALIGNLPDGAMLAVTLSEEEIRPLLHAESGIPDLSLAVISGPRVCVVAGPESAIAAAEAQLAARNVVTKRLVSTRAFHSTMMEPIAAALTDQARRISLNAPTIPYISNVTGTWITAEQATDPGYWARHLCQAVRFSDGMQLLVQDTDAVFLEVGPGRLLSSLAVQHAPDANPGQFIAISSLRHAYEQRADRAVILEALGQLWLAGVAVDWSKLYAGTDGAERRMRMPLPTYPFERQRYWIEPQSRPGTLPQARSLDKQIDIADWFYLPSWKRSLPPATIESQARAAQPRHWLIFADELEIAAALAERLAHAGHTPILILSGGAFARLADDRYTLDPRDSSGYHSLLAELHAAGRMPETIVHMWSLTSDEQRRDGRADFEPAQQRGFYSLLFLLQAIGAVQRATPLELILVANQSQRVTSLDQLAPEKATIHALSRVIPQEYPRITCRSIDLALSRSSSSQRGRLVEVLLAELLSGSRDLAIAYRGRDRWVETYERAPLEHGTGRPIWLREQGVYLVIGALENIGMLAAAYLAKTVRARLALSVKPEFPVPPRDTWDNWLATHAADEYISAGITNVRTLEAQGAEVLVMNADVTQPGDMRAMIDQARHHFGALDGVIYAAGLFPEESLRAISDTGYTECSWHFQPRCHGVYVLDQVLREEPLDFCLLISSLSGVVGGVGFAGYAATATFMDAFAQHHNQEASVPWSSVDWHGVSDAETLEVFHRIFSANLVDQLIVSTSDLEAMLDTWVRHPVPPAQPQQQVEHTGTSYRRARVRTEYVAPRNSAEQTLVDFWRDLLGIDEIGVHDNFFALGGDSLLGVQLVAQTKQAGLRLSIKDLFQNPTIAELAALNGDAAAEPAQPSGDEQSATPKRTIQELAIAARQAAQPQPTEPATGPVPLTIGQRYLLEWKSPHHANIAALLEVPADSQPALLERATRLLLLLHDGLRARFTQTGSGWQQIIAKPDDSVPLSYIDLSDVPESEQPGKIEATSATLQTSLDIFAGPLIRVALFGLGPKQPARLLVIASLLVTDAFAFQILLSDLLAIYRQLEQNQPVQLPAKTASVREWMAYLTEYAQSAAIVQDLAYWQALPWSQLTPLPVDYSADRSANLISTRRQVTATLSVEATAALLQAVPQSDSGHVRNMLLTALAQTLGAWSGSPLVHVGVVEHGRDTSMTDIDLSRTVADLTYRSRYLLDVSGVHSPSAALQAVNDQIRRVPHDSIGYDMLAYLNRDPAIVEQMRALPQFEVVFNYQGHLYRTRSGEIRLAPESIGPTEDPRNLRPVLLGCTATIRESRLHLTWGYSERFHRRATIERLAGSMITSLHKLIEDCQRPPNQTTESLTGPVPLTTGQHWLFRWKKPEYCNMATLLEVPAATDPTLLQQAAQQLVQHHAALRIRFVHEDSRWQQFIAARDDSALLNVYDLRHLSHAEQQQVIEATAATLQTSLNLFAGPLLRIALFQLGNDHPARLLIICSHLVVDGFSFQIVLEDLLNGYQHLRHGGPIQLPPTTTTFDGWAEFLAGYADSPEILQDLDYWRGLPWSQLPQIPFDYPVDRSANTLASRHQLNVELTAEETHALLHDVRAVAGMEVKDLLLAALALTMAEWTGAPLTHIASVEHARDLSFPEIDLLRTVGDLTYRSQYLLDLSGADSPGAALEAVKAQSRRVPHHGLSYDLLLYVNSDPAVNQQMRAIPHFDLCLNYRGPVDETAARRAGSAAEALRPADESSGPTETLDGMRHVLIGWSVWISQGRLKISWVYSANLYRHETIERQAHSLLATLRGLIRHCQQLPDIDQPGPEPSQAQRTNRNQSTRTVPVPLLHNSLVFLDVDQPNYHHWNIAFLLETQQPLERALLEDTLAALLRHHDALRLRLTRHADRWSQQIVPPDDALPLSWIDLAHLPPDQHRAHIEAIATQHQAALNLTTGPVLRVAYFARASQPGYLLLIVHHLVADAYSLRILLDDFETAYQQRAANRPIQLPPTTTTISEWAERMYRYAQSAEIRQDIAYWTSLPWAEVAPLPLDHPDGLSGNTFVTERRVWASLTQEETRILLQKLLPAYEMYAQEVLLAGIAAAVARWKGSRLVSADMLMSGRDSFFADVDLSRTVGYITTGTLVVLDLRNAETPDEILRAVRHHLRNIPHQGLTHSLLSRVTEDAEVTKIMETLPLRDIVFNYQGLHRSTANTTRLFQPIPAALGPAQDPQLGRRVVLEFRSLIADDQLHLRVEYSAKIHDQQTIEPLARACIEEVRRFIRHYQQGEESSGAHRDLSGVTADPVPLTPNMHRSFETIDPDRQIWNIATLLEVAQPLDPGFLQEALRAVLAHHDALRLRSVQTQDGWKQFIADVEQETPFSRIELSTIPVHEQAAAIEEAATALQATLNITHGPLLRVALFELGPGRTSRLLVFVHHTACDRYSWQIVLNDLFQAYQQLSQGKPLQLPPPATAYKEYAERAAAYACSPELKAELDYWRSEARREVAPLPVDHLDGQHTGESARRLNVALTAAETQALLDRSAQVRINEVLLATLALTFNEWTSAPSLLVDVVWHGRDPIFGPLDLSRTVGWFDQLVPLLLQVSKPVAFETAAQKIRAQLEAIPHDGQGYGLLRYLSPDAAVREALQALPEPQVLFNYRGQITGDKGQSGLPFQLAQESWGRDHSAQVIRRHLLIINAQLVSGRLEINWEYSAQVHRQATIERLAGHFMDTLRMFLSSGEQDLHKSMRTVG